MGGLTKKLLATAVEQSLEPIAGAVDFDGTNDYLSRSSDLVGNVDSKTFTFSAWVYPTANVFHLLSGADTSSYIFEITSSRILGYSPSGATAIHATFNSATFPINTFFHLLIACDLSDPLKRHVYVNDREESVIWQTYADHDINFTWPSFFVSALTGGSPKSKNRLSHVFLDYTYRDLSIEANRRLFITADRKPADGLEALNPILYLPLTDPTQPGKNLGTGGDFALTGVVARSGRGPNQFNAPYSDLDGSADYLSRTSALIGVANGKQLTLHLSFSPDVLSSGPLPISFEYFNGSQYFYKLALGINPDGSVSVIANATPSGTAIFATTPAGTCVAGRNYTFSMSFDVTSAAKRHIYINGIPASVTWNAYADLAMWLSLNAYHVGINRPSGGTYTNGKVGNVFFDTRYIDLSQPANLAKFVTGTGIDAKPVDLGANGELPFGTPPLIYLPMYGNNAGKNYGTGGDFTVNSGPFPGARGPNEYWGNKADFNGSTGYLARTSALTGVSDGKVVSGCVWVNVARATQETVLCIGDWSSSAFGLQLDIASTGGVQVRGYDSTPAMVLASVGGADIAANTTACIMFAFDLSNTSRRHVYVNGQLSAQSWVTFANADLRLSGARPTVAATWNGTGYTNHLDGVVSELYFTTDYIDFSQEANRLKFRDAFGNPVDLMPQIEAGEIPNPAIYMRFDPANFGKNSGTGGDFTVNGTITDGGQL